MKMICTESIPHGLHYLKVGEEFEEPNEVRANMLVFLKKAAIAPQSHVKRSVQPVERVKPQETEPEGAIHAQQRDVPPIQTENMIVEKPLQASVGGVDDVQKPAKRSYKRRDLTAE